MKAWKSNTCRQYYRDTDLRLLAVSLMVGLTLTLFSCKSSQHVSDNYHREMSDDYRVMIDIADRSASRDELSKILVGEHKVVCASSPMKDISRASFDQNGKFAILDSSGPGVYLFANNGSYIGQLGSKGRGPGRYKIPWSVTSTGAGFAVADFLDHRVNIFNDDQRFLSSFIYSVQRFSATGIQYDPLGREFYLFGNHVQLPDQDRTVDFVHIYSDSGEFQGSIYQLPSMWLKANYTAVDTPLLAIDGKNGQYFMFAFDRVLFSISQPNSNVSQFLLTLPGFVPPPGPLPSAQKGLNTVLSWDLKFTPIRAIAVYGGNTVVEFESHRGLRYTVALFRNGHTEPSRTIETNYLLLGINSDGMAVFTNNPGSLRHDIRELTYGRFAI